MLLTLHRGLHIIDQFVSHIEAISKAFDRGLAAIYDHLGAILLGVWSAQPLALLAIGAEWGPLTLTEWPP